MVAQPFPPLFPLYFIAGWVFIATALGIVGGWFRLQRYYPADDEQLLLTLRGRSGSMGLVDLRGVLTLSACRSGLRVRVWRLFAPFQRPILVPWREIACNAPRALKPASVELTFGAPAHARLRIKARDWEQLCAAAGKADAVVPAGW